MATVPLSTAVTMPWASTVATLGLLECQVGFWTKVLWPPSEKVVANLSLAGNEAGARRHQVQMGEQGAEASGREQIAAGKLTVENGLGSSGRPVQRLV